MPRRQYPPKCSLISKDGQMNLKFRQVSQEIQRHSQIQQQRRDWAIIGREISFFSGLIDDERETHARIVLVVLEKGKNYVRTPNTRYSDLYPRARTSKRWKEEKTTEEVDGREEQNEKRSPRNDGDLRCHTEDRRHPSSRTRRRELRPARVSVFGIPRNIFMCPPRAGSACVPSFLLLSPRHSLPLSLFPSRTSLRVHPVLFDAGSAGCVFGGGYDAPPSVRPRRNNQGYPMTKNIPDAVGSTGWEIYCSCLPTTECF